MKFTTQPTLVLFTIVASGISCGATIQTPPSPQSLAAVDAAACAEVVRSGLWKKIQGDDEESDSLTDPEDPHDNWDFQAGAYAYQQMIQQVIHIQSHDYVLGVWSGDPKPGIFIDEELPPEHAGWVKRDMARLKHRTGPVFLARRGTDGLVSIVCEFKNTRHFGFSSHRVMTPLELLAEYARIDSVTLGREATKVRGLWGAQALLAASQKVPPRISPLSSDLHGSVLGDAIEAHRDDILRFYLDHGISPDLTRGKHHFDPTSTISYGCNDPLFTAVAEDALGSMHLLLEHGASPDAKGSFDLNTPICTWDPLPVLARTVIKGQLPVVKILLGYGADPNFKSGPSGEVETIVRDVIYQHTPVDDEFTGAHELFLHGADPNPFVDAFLREYAIRGSDRQSKYAWSLVLKYDGHPVETRLVREVFASSGSYLNNSAQALLNDALQFRDAPDCDPNTPAGQLPVCLPNTLKHAEAKAKLPQRDRLLVRLEQKCNIHITGKHTHGGWLAYVLSDQTRAQCALDELAGNQH